MDFSLPFLIGLTIGLRLFNVLLQFKIELEIIVKFKICHYSFSYLHSVIEILPALGGFS